MVSWIVWIALYGLVGSLLGEVYLLGMRRAKEDPSTLAYILGTSIWPITLIIGISLIFKRSKP